MPPLTDYFGHDEVYRRRRAEGRSGWDADEKSVQQTIATITSFLLPQPPAATLIEFGCGAGDLSLYFAQMGFHVTGIDIAPFAIEWARQKAAQQSLHATFLVADLTRDLDLPPPTADIVLDGHCLHCIVGPDRQTFLRNVRRCLKPEGVFHVNTMCGDPHPPHDRSFDHVSRCIITQGIALRYFGTPEGILGELTQGGFQIDRQQVIPAQYEGDEDCLLANARIRA